MFCNANSHSVDRGARPADKSLRFADKRLRFADKSLRFADKSVHWMRGFASLALVFCMAVCAVALIGCAGSAESGASTSTQEDEAAMAVVEDTPAQDADAADTDADVASTDAAEDTNSDATAAATDAAAATDERAAEFALDPSRTDWQYPEVSEKTVYLTFDDGPSTNTQDVLDILDSYGIKATFFVTGINPDYLDMIGECYRRGHTIGMHTFTHDYAQVYASVDAYWADLGQIADVVRDQIGYVPCFVRFPGGSSNAISADYTPGIMTELSQLLPASGYQYYDWDASCGDGAEHTADELVEATKADTSYGYTTIVFLMHDGAGKATTVDALPRIIEYFQSEGYAFAPIDRSTPPAHHGISN